MLAAIIGFLTAFPKLVDLGTGLLAAYQAHVKVLWFNALQAGLQPLENGPTTDAQKSAAAKAVADAIASMH